jgi:hypothetical protein
MSALVTYAGADVIRGELHIPIRGTWWADLKLDTSDAPAVGSSSSIEAAGGVKLAGTIIRSGSFIGSSAVRVAGGAGGLSKVVPPAAFQTAMVRDVLSAIVGPVGEKAASSISPTITNQLLQLWTVTGKAAAQLLDELCWAIGELLGQHPINWRPLGDGSIWVGAESWPVQSLPSGADVLWHFPASPRFEIGCDTPSLLPGVSLSDIGGAHVLGVDHWIEPHSIRTWAWT